MTPTDEIDRLNTALAGRYRVERELGRGGMATVYLASDQRHDREVALKLLRPEVARLLGAERFTREIAILARLNHPHILPLLDSGSADGLLWYAMPYVRGESLRDRLRRESPLRVDEALTIVRHAAAALDHAHAQGLVHRDIKPENILLHEGEAMVADFGIAAVLSPDRDARITSAGMALGTPTYMSPEQAAGDPTLDARSDVFSLAAVLYELLTGEPPHTGPTPQTIMVKRFTDPVPSIRRLRPAVPAAVDAAVQRALALAPADRFASCGAFVAALDAPAAPGVEAASVAVLPFQALGGEPDGTLFADGVTEDVTTQLAKIRAVRVIAHGSAMQFRDPTLARREIAARLGVRTLLEGSVRHAGDRVRIIARLVDAATERQLWAETYDRQSTDIFGIQADVALHIAAALRAELSSEEQQRLRPPPMPDFRAYQLYLRGRQWFTHYTEASLATAIECFEQAIALAPDYALAWVGLARAYAEVMTIQVQRLVPEAPAKAKAAAARALALDPGLGGAHEVMGLVRMIYDFDWESAEASFRLALHLSPNDADAYDHYGWLCWSVGRFDEAVELVRRARALDPLAHRSDVAAALLRAGRYAEAAEAARQLISVDPTFARGHSALGWALILQGDLAGGVAALEQSVAVSQDDPAFLGQLGQAYAMAGRTDAARAVLGRLEAMAARTPVSPYSFAYVHTGLGEHDTAIARLEQALEERSGAVFGIDGSFLFASLRAHPRYQALRRRLNLPEVPRAAR